MSKYFFIFDFNDKITKIMGFKTKKHSQKLVLAVFLYIK